MTTSTLRGKRVLITRPEHQSEHWRARLEAEGAQVDSIPMLAIEALRDTDSVQAIKNRILDFDQYQHAIFVSQNAVHIGCDWLENYWPQLPLEPHCYAIGAATGRALAARGIRCTLNVNTNTDTDANANANANANAMDSESLLALPTLQAVAGQRVLILRGRGGRTRIGDTLAARGARVEHCELYRRVMPPEAPAQLAGYRGIPDAISVHSGETLHNLARSVAAADRKQLLATPLICPSQRVALQAQQLGFTRARAAHNAGDDAMLSALKEALDTPLG